MKFKTSPGKRAIMLLCALLPLLMGLGCENPTENITNEYYTADALRLTLAGAYGVAHPNDAGKQTNYLVLAVEQGDYTKGTYTLNGTAVTPTQVLTDGGRAALVKIAAPAETTAYTLAVNEGETSLLDEAGSFDAAGVAAPEVVYGEKFMTFSEFFHDVTANIADIRPSSTVFAATGYVAEPKKFINAGTRTGNNSAGAANGTSKWVDTDLLPKVDAISSATYGDAAHFVPTQNLARNYPDSSTKADWHEVEGINTVEVGVDFDLFANADLLRQAGKAVATSAAVLAQAEDIAAWKASTEVYKAKYLQADASWGRRDQTAITEAKGKDWPKAINDVTVNVTYGGTWAEKVISVDFAPLPAGLDNTGIWNNYFDYVYAAYVEDLQTGHREPLVWLQNLFSHRGHTNLEAVLQRSGFSRLDALSPAGNFKLVIFAQGFKDIIVEKAADAYEGQSSAAIEQGTAFYVDSGGNTLKGSNGAALEEGNKLHVGGLSTAALADFGVNGGKILKGTAEVSESFELRPEGEGEVEIEFKDSFFTGAFQGSYSFNVTPSPGKQYSAVSFAVNRIIERPQLKQGTGAASNADTADGAIEVTTGGGNITFDNEEFAKAILVSGRTASSMVDNADASGTVTIGTVLKTSESGYYIDPGALTSGKTYKLTIQASNFVKADLTNIAPVVYYIKVQ